MPALNYATEYGRSLDQMYPYVLNFGALYATPNNGRYKWVNANTIKIPTIKVGGRVAVDRDTIGGTTRNYDNSWQTKTLNNGRKWKTSVHPEDIQQTNMVATIENITTTMNNEEKFPEMDAYLVSKVFSDWRALDYAPDIVSLSTANVLSTFDKLMQRMDERRVPGNGRILYVTPAVNTLIKNASGIVRNMDVQTGDANIYRMVKALDLVSIVAVPPELMKTVYDFTVGWVVAATAKQIDMFLVHPMSVITPVNYSFAQLDPPSAGSDGKWIYFEEDDEDVFILEHKADGIAFVMADAGAAGALTVASAAGTATAGDTVITVAGNGSAAGNTLAYKIASTAIDAPDLGDTVEGYTALSSNPATLTGQTASHYIRVVELNKDNKVVRTGTCQLNVKA
jgi:hypothetical protein